MLSTLQSLSVIHTAAPDRGKLMTLVADKRRRLLFAGDGRRSVYDKKPQRYAEITEQNLIVRSGKSETAAIYIKGCARSIVLLKLTRQKESIARFRCDSRARAVSLRQQSYLLKLALAMIGSRCSYDIHILRNTKVAAATSPKYSSRTGPGPRALEIKAN